MGKLEKRNGFHVARLRGTYSLLYAEREFFAPVALTAVVVCGLLVAGAIIFGQ